MEWEYQIVKVRENLKKRESVFYILGINEWELVAVDKGMAYFKRLVPATISVVPPGVCSLSDKARTKIKAYFKVDDDFVDDFEKMVTKARNEE